MRPVGVTLANWQEPGHTGWGYRHVRELIPSARIAHSETAVALLPPDGPVPTGLAVEQVAADARSDGVLVLHRGQVVGMLRQLGVKPPVTDLIFYLRDLKTKQL